MNYALRCQVELLLGAAGGSMPVTAWANEAENLLRQLLGQPTNELQASQLSVPPCPVKDGKIVDKFWLIQSDLVDIGNNDSFGRYRVQNPGKSIQPTREDCFQGCEALARKTPGRKYYVMEAVAVVETAGPPVTRKSLV